MTSQPIISTDRPGVLLAHVCDQLKPSLLRGGFHFESRNKAESIDYRRPGQRFSLSWDHSTSRLVAELLDAKEKVQETAVADCQPPADIQARLGSFVACVRQFLDRLPDPK